MKILYTEYRSVQPESSPARSGSRSGARERERGGGMRGRRPHVESSRGLSVFFFGPTIANTRQDSIEANKSRWIFLGFEFI